MTLEIGPIVGLLLTLFIYSYVVYKETILFKFATFTFLGVSIGNILVVATKTIQTGVLGKISQGEYIYTVPLILGLFVFTRLTEKYKDLSRWGIAILLGSTIGLVIARDTHTHFRSLSGMITQVISANTPLGYLNGIILIFGAIAVILYFQFTSYWDKPFFKQLRNVSRVFLMIGFGAQFGATVLTRLSTLTARILFILQTLGIA
jgi:hypothetical protein